jgi:predicted DsbA family dithiol-disulfide isomerase
MAIFEISIISDTTCPWCYIGYRRLQKAIALFQKTYPGGSRDAFNIVWRPYYLKPDAPTQGVLIQGMRNSIIDTDFSG